MKQLRDYQLKSVNECWNALKVNDEPVLLMASVGAGKSLMLADILLTMQKAGKSVLSIVSSAELVRNNAQTFAEQGGSPSVYCASLNSKETSNSIVFGTPQTVINAIKNNEELASKIFNMIVIDEAHMINYINDTSLYMRILRHYKQLYPDMRVLGATGTNYRFKGYAIVGDKCLFKSQVGNIETDWLIANDFLVKPQFKVDSKLMLDFSKVKVKKSGQFDAKQLQDVVENSARLTELICKQIIHIVTTQNRFGVFIFATTKKHAHEIYSHLPAHKSAIILGNTPQNERTEILDKARQGVIKYLVNISIISVGVDVPPYDTIAYMRPTESLVLLVQTMGRVLRLSPNTNKTEGLVLDFAGNIERHADWDNPIIMDAIQQTINKDKFYDIICPKCQQMNTENARRCIGVSNGTRCDYYFEFRECFNDNCNARNDIVARECRACGTELIDPNNKLSLYGIHAGRNCFEVIESKYWISGTERNFFINCVYKYRDQDKENIIAETFYPCRDKASLVFYGQFIKKHCIVPGRWYRVMGNIHQMQLMLQEALFPDYIEIEEKKGKQIIHKKHFLCLMEQKIH